MLQYGQAYVNESIGTIIDRSFPAGQAQAASAAAGRNAGKRPDIVTNLLQLTRPDGTTVAPRAIWEIKPNKAPARAAGTAQLDLYAVTLNDAWKAGVPTAVDLWDTGPDLGLTGYTWKCEVQGVRNHFLYLRIEEEAVGLIIYQWHHELEEARGTTHHVVSASDQRKLGSAFPGAVVKADAEFHLSMDPNETMAVPAEVGGVKDNADAADTN